MIGVGGEGKWDEWGVGKWDEWGAGCMELERVG